MATSNPVGLRRISRRAGSVPRSPAVRPSDDSQPRSARVAHSAIIRCGWSARPRDAVRSRTLSAPGENARVPGFGVLLPQPRQLHSIIAGGAGPGTGADLLALDP